MRAFLTGLRTDLKNDIEAIRGLKQSYHGFNANFAYLAALDPNWRSRARAEATSSVPVERERLFACPALKSGCQRRDKPAQLSASNRQSRDIGAHGVVEPDDLVYQLSMYCRPLFSW